jgi:hypothetical protein
MLLHRADIISAAAEQTEGLPLPSFRAIVAMSAGKSPPPEMRGASIPSDHSAVRRDQISVKLSSPSPFTREA